jgi:anti-sigma regulatory factor (Ser/Thr protein kinase)
LDVLDPDVDEATAVELLVSELATNAVRHARTSFEVAIWVGSKTRVEVSDGSPVPPRRSVGPGSGDEGGRGLILVDRLALAWGFHLTGHGKTVWFEASLSHR